MGQKFSLRLIAKHVGPASVSTFVTGLSVRKKPENLLKIQGGRQNKEKQSLS